MEYESVGGFVAMDIELQAPLFRLGFIGGTEYADIPDAHQDSCLASKCTVDGEAHRAVDSSSRVVT